jgi:lipopolysaccharide transport system ATP-binding protein
MKPIIEVKNLSKKYRLSDEQPYYALRDSIAGFFKNPLQSVKDHLNTDEFWALKDVNFTINQGEVIGIIGRNGAGKSTLLKILSQITPPTTGEVILRGRVGSLLEVGTGFSPELSGRENIFLNGAILGMKRTEVLRKFDEIVDFAEVEKFLDLPLKRYSSGMYMRLAFAVAAHLEPEILIVDEVLAVGDSEFQKKCLGKMGEVANEGRTVLFVSHNLVTVQNLCEKSILLQSGEIVQFGDTKEVIDTYLSDKPTARNKVALNNLNLEGNAGDIRFTTVEITNINESNIIKSDDKLRIKLGYKSQHTKVIIGARIVITIMSESSQQVVMRLDSDVTGKTLPNKLQPDGEIICETNTINLSEGKFSINVDFLIQGSSCDYAVRAGEFTVVTDLQKYNYQAPPDKTVCDHVIGYSFTQNKL